MVTSETQATIDSILATRSGSFAEPLLVLIADVLKAPSSDPSDDAWEQRAQAAWDAFDAFLHNALTEDIAVMDRAFKDASYIVARIGDGSLLARIESAHQLVRRHGRARSSAHVSSDSEAPTVRVNLDTMPPLDVFDWDSLREHFAHAFLEPTSSTEEAHARVSMFDDARWARIIAQAIDSGQRELLQLNVRNVAGRTPSLGGMNDISEAEAPLFRQLVAAGLHTGVGGTRTLFGEHVANAFLLSLAHEVDGGAS